GGAREGLRAGDALGAAGGGHRGACGEGRRRPEARPLRPGAAAPLLRGALSALPGRDALGRVRPMTNDELEAAFRELVAGTLALATAFVDSTGDGMGVRALRILNQA